MDTDAPTPIAGGGEACVSVRYRGRDLYPQVSPESAALRRVAALTPQPNTLYLLPSPLLFYGVPELLAKIPESSRLLCVEADQALMKFSLKWVPKHRYSHPRTTFIRANSGGAVVSVVREIGIWNFRRVELVSLSGGYSLHRFSYREILSLLDTEIRSFWRNKMTLIHIARLWVKNLYRNLARLALDGCTTIPSTTDLTVRAPVIVIGAGASLESTLRFLKWAQGKACLLAVDTALPILKDAGIEPTLVIALESQHVNLKDFMDWKGSGLPILTDLTAHPAPIRILDGPVFYFSSRITERMALLDRVDDAGLLPEIFPPLGSVGIAAIHAALHLTEEPVFFTGLDFSYELGKTHAVGAPSWRTTMINADRFSPPGWFGACLARPLVRCRDKFGRECITDTVLESYRDLLRTIADGGQRDRLFDMGVTGLDTGAEFVDESKAREAIGTAAVDTLFTVGTRRAASTGRSLQTILKGELSLLDAVIDTGREYIGRDRSDRVESILLQALQVVDYVTAHFPEGCPNPIPEIGYLKRAVFSAQNYRRYLGALLGRA